MTTKKGVFLAFLVLCMSDFVLASKEIYSFQLDGAYLSSEQSSNFERDGYNLSLAYFFGKYRSNTYPLAEQPFIQRRHSIYAEYAHLKETQTSVTVLSPDLIGAVTPEFKFERDKYQLGGEYHFSAVPIFVGLSYAEAREDHDVIRASFVVTQDIGPIKDRHIALGWYVRDTTRLLVEYEDSKQKVRSTQAVTFGPDFLSVESESTVQAWRVGVRHLLELPTGHLALELGFASRELESTFTFLQNSNPFQQNNQSFGSEVSGIDSYRIGTHYYPIRQIGLAAAYQLTDHPQFGAHNYSLSSEWFVTEKIKLQVGYQRSDPKREGTSTDAYAIGASWRY